LLSCYEDEYSYVLDGTIGGRVGDHEVVAGQGSYVVEPAPRADMVGHTLALRRS
jgi:uncharacterized cupin superfamily protein